MRPHERPGLISNDSLRFDVVTWSDSPLVAWSVTMRPHRLPAPRDARVVSGFIEGSNVNAVLELTDMIDVSRTYTSVAKMISQADELRGASIEKLAKVG